MTTTRKCPECGTDLPADTPEGHCPKCMLRVGLGSQPDAGGTQPVAAPPQAPSPAELAPHFPQLEILELLGQGGMGIVYKARQPRLDRLTALKILPADPARDPSFAERFAREAQALARLSHPNIVSVYDFGETNGIFYLLMEFVDGLNLRQLEQAGQLTPREALKIVPAICEALQYAHDIGIVHRDIKPENILLDRGGRVKIADFGLAKLLGRAAADRTLTQEQQVMGTMNYMAPEQMERPGEVDHRADIYSLGVVFYEMLTGELPLGRFALPSEKVQIDVRLDQVVLRSLEKERERRYQHVSEVKTDLERIATAPAPAAGQLAASQAAAEWHQALRSVRGPAIGLLVVGILNWLIIPVFTILGLHLSARQGASLSSLVIALTVAAVASSFIIFASFKMKALQAYWAALTGSILAMILSPGNLVGLPIGIWAVVTLSQASIRRAFKAAPPATGSAVAGLPPVSGTPADPARRWFFTAATVVLIGAALIVALVLSAFVVALALPVIHRAKAQAQQQREAARLAAAEPVRVFDIGDTPVAQDLVVTNGAWTIQTTDNQVLQLFTVPDPGIENALLIYDARMKTENLHGRAYLEMWCRFPGKGEFFSRGFDTALSGTTDWTSSNTQFMLRPGERPDRVRLNLVVEGAGRVWIDQVRLLKAPLPESASLPGFAPGLR